MLAYSRGRMEVPVIIDGKKIAVGFAGEVSLRGVFLFSGGLDR